VSPIKLAAALAAALTLAAGAGSARAASPTDKRIAALTKQVNALQKQVRALSTRLARNERELNINYAGDTCSAALLSDLQLGTWAVVDQIAQATQGRTYFGQQAPVSDFQNCSFLASPDVPRPAPQTPPSIRLLDPLMQWLHIE
jgi:hypothetical protein